MKLKAGKLYEAIDFINSYNDTDMQCFLEMHTKRGRKENTGTVCG